MLTHLHIKNLAIVDDIALDFSNGMHVITGETGAGKSILLDALGLTLGMRASANVVGPRRNQAEISAQFGLTELPEVVTWLQQHDLLETEHDCIIKRIISADGRSRSYINGSMVTVNQLKTLGAKLVNIHSQHQHHSLLNSNHQRQLLDQYANHSQLATIVRQEFEALSKYQREYQKLQAIGLQADKLQLLNYQIEEIENLSLELGELPALHTEHTILAKMDDQLNKAQTAQSIIANDYKNNEYNLMDSINTASGYLKELCKVDKNLTSALECLQQAAINLEETNNELINYINSQKPDPAKLNQIEQRLSNINQTARKNRTTPEHLLEHYANLCEQRDTLLTASNELTAIKQKIETTQQNYFAAANKLSESRKLEASMLANAITLQLKKLDLPNARFEVKITTQTNLIASYGLNEVVFNISTNLGQSPQPLKTIASGGELSRVSLAIQVISAEIVRPPTLIFDEVDVGISGKTAEIVGNLLNILGKKAQVICITHLPQVACRGQHHYKVSKHQANNTTCTEIQLLNEQERINEVARLLGGVAITPEAIANAEAMLI